MQSLISLRNQRDAIPPQARRVFAAKRKRGPGRNAKDSPHRKGGRLTLRTRLSKRIRQRANRERRRAAEVGCP